MLAMLEFQGGQRLLPLLTLVLSALFPVQPAFLFAESKEACVFVTRAGKVEQVLGREKVPREYQAQAKCFGERGEVQQKSARTPEMAAPSEVKLEGAQRHVDMASSVGRIRLRWPRSAEVLFGQTPERAMASAARAVSRALKQSAFPPRIRTLDLDWEVVFMDQEVPAEQIPQALISNCHPGWMTPPSNIYIVAQRVVAGCATTEAERKRKPGGDAQLAEVLIHEMGHVVEFQLAGAQFGGDRMRAEGFATWFQWYAADFAEGLRGGGSRELMHGWARQALARGEDAPFHGSAADYARAGTYIEALVERRGVAGLVATYQGMTEDSLSFFTAAERRLNWDKGRFHEEALRLIGE